MRLRRAVVLSSVLMIGLTLPAAATQPEKVIVLPGASSAEGIAAGHGSEFFAGDLLRGDIFRGDARRGKAELFIDAPDGRIAVGMTAELRHDLLFVAGGATGQAYVYDTRRRTTAATYQFVPANQGFINDVTLTRDGAWFTDSMNPQLYFVPLSHFGKLGPSKTLALSGPAADTSGSFNLNGINTTPDGRALIVAHSSNGQLYRVDARTGTSQLVAGVSVPGADGVARDGRTVWVVQGVNRVGGNPVTGQVDRVRLTADGTAGTHDKVITSTKFQTPATAAKLGNKLAVVNAKFDTGFPPTADRYEVVVTNS
ncbi:hypothetical protein LWC34_51215 [Kibdelosporangium philippinense]|uniref:Superoxide dismutase n=1 Tax=Kibdelosporangium philippinense TaxID=211113 RepID=A0ABS8ZTS9_9PSEU|nr:hypothetical protein [Kibdelosporangium philippinense]MCE7011123.1 hypothetical protein [Kibdelosporangium philippinense]